MTTDIELENMTAFVESINVYNAGEIICYNKQNEKFNKICAVWQGMLAASHQMPAYGVSLHGETSKAIKEGVWVEFNFAQTFSNGGMPFEKLLVHADPEATGFNVIRYNKGVGYDGRCFYFDLLNHDMSDFYNCLIS